MGRTAKVYVVSGIYTIETDLYDGIKSHYKNIAPELWGYMYPFYLVDEHGRLMYLYEGGRGMGAKSVAKDIQRIEADPHPSTAEIFDTVEIIDEDSEKTLKTLSNVDLVGILRGIKEVMET